MPETIEQNKARSNATRDLPWRLPPWPWIVHPGDDASPRSVRRVLICGAIPEAFLLAKSLPGTEIVILESDAEKSAAFRLSGSRRRLKNIKVVHASLENSLEDFKLGQFEVLLALATTSKPSHLGMVLKNLASLLVPDRGTLYLRVAGEGHPAFRPREISEAWPMMSSDFKGEHFMRMAAAIAGDEFFTEDFEGHIRLSLEDWIDALKSNHLYFSSALHVPSLLARALSSGGLSGLGFPDLSELASATDIMVRPAIRHLLATNRPQTAPPWESMVDLLDWRPCARFWPREKIPLQIAPYHQRFSVEIHIQGVLPPISLQLSSYMLELLRLSDGSASLGELLSAIPHPANPEDIKHALYFLHCTAILPLLSPNQ